MIRVPLFSMIAFALMLGAGELAAQSSNHFKPEGHVLGDVHPFFRDGECFLYYLKPKSYESTLVRSRDWLHWQSAKLSHEPKSPEDWMSPYFVLGVFHDDEAKVYRSFYGHAQGRMASSVSTDLVHWACALKEFHVPPGVYYERRRDPYVFWIPEMKQYGCVMTTWMKGRTKEKGGAISLATSPDLKQWTDRGAILDPGDIGEPECPQMFALGGRWYLLASIYDRAVGAPVYWTSASPLGPWKKTPDGKLDGKDLCAAQIAVNGDTPLLFGWVPLTPAKPGAQTWGGHLALPREVHALPTGKLGVRLPATLVNLFDNLPWKPTEGTWKRLAAKFDVTMPGTDIEVRIKFPPLGEVTLGGRALRVLDAAGECWSEVPVELPAGQQVQLRVLVDGDIVEVFAGDRYSLAARVPYTPGLLRLDYHAEGANVTLQRAAEWSPK